MYVSCSMCERGRSCSHMPAVLPTVGGHFIPLTALQCTLPMWDGSLEKIDLGR